MKQEFLIQKYIHDLLKLGGLNSFKDPQKFEIRAFVLVVGFGNKVQSYFYNDGYCRVLSELEQPSTIQASGFQLLETHNEKTGFGKQDSKTNEKNRRSDLHNLFSWSQLNDALVK